MRFWDASAVLPLLSREAGSDLVRRLLREDPEPVIWWGTRIECMSALWRKFRAGALERASLEEAKTRLLAFEADAVEVVPREEVRSPAERLLAVHGLHAADALQLAAALDWAKGRPRGHGFVSLDARLGEAARREGFAWQPGQR